MWEVGCRALSSEATEVRIRWERGTGGRVEFLRVHGKEADEGVAGQDVEVNVRERLQLVFGRRRRHEGEEEAEPGDFRGFLQDVHAEQVLGDDALLDVIERRGVLGLHLLEPGGEFGVRQELDAANDGGVEGDEDFHRGHKERAGAAGRIEQAERGEDVEQEGAAERGVEVQEEVGDRRKGGRMRDEG